MESRLLLSTGTTQNIESVSDIAYRSDAFLPSQTWRAPHREERSAIFVADPNPLLFEQYRSSSVGVIQIPSNVLAPMIALLDELKLRSLTQKRFDELDYDRMSNHRGYDRANQILLDHVQSYALWSHNPKLIGLHFQPPGLRTVTVGFDDSVTPKSRCRVGLHIDNWDRLPLLQKHQSRNRICINLGREDRFFLFINQPLRSLVRSLDEFDRDELVRQEQWIAVSNAYMRQYPFYPVVQLRVAPGEAYVAPTDNLIHDASSLGKRDPDITWTALGYFGWSPSTKDCI